ncbi:MAG: helix-turn-helix domain-containing protein [Chloroflexota bacterium]
MAEIVARIVSDVEVKPDNCPVTFCLKKIGGKWKPIIIYLIRNGANRFGIMQRSIEGISKQMLTKQLRELEADGILKRTIYAEIPPRVEYSITPYGQTLMPIVDAMSEWGREQMNLVDG